MLDRKKQFIVEQALISSVAASVKLRQRRFYRSASELKLNQNAYSKRKDLFRNAFADLLIEAANKVNGVASKNREKELLTQIGWIKEKLERIKDNLLVEEQPAFGVAQKALNLFLKYLWCFDLIEQPPHCPIDGQILGKIAWADKPWPLFNREDYEEAIKQVRNKAGDKSIGEWELLQFKPSVQINWDKLNG